MKYLKSLGLLVIAAAALTAFAGTASATTLTSPAGTTYTGEFKASSGAVNFTGSFVKVECSNSELQGNVESHGAGITATIKLFTITFSLCNYKITVHATGGLVFHCCAPPRVSAEAGIRIVIHTSVGECEFTPNNTELGTVTTGSPAILDIASAKIPRTGGSFLCGSSGTWNGTYTVNTPSSLSVD